MSWPAGCDQFWSDLNAGCSDEFGRYITPPGGGSATINVIGGQNPILPQIVTRAQQGAVGQSSAPSASREIIAGVQNSTLFLVGVGVLALTVWWKRN